MILYTSGTTGRPKGVMLEQRNIAHNIRVLPPIVGIEPGDVWVSVLPSWHSFEQTVELVGFSTGCQIVYSDKRRLRDDLREPRPHYFASVPRIWETIYKGAVDAIRKRGKLASFLFAAAYRTVPEAEALRLELWSEALDLGQRIPTLPLWLEPDIAVPLDLEATYTTACRNINGAINVETLSAEVRFDDTIDAASTIALFEQFEQANLTAPRIIVICDNARYYKSKAVAAYLTTSRIQLEPLPPYCPNLNLIERYWRFFKKEILYGKYYETFALFKRACDDFFAASERYKDVLRSLLTDNFQIIGCA